MIEFTIKLAISNSYKFIQMWLWGPVITDKWYANCHPYTQNKMF